MTAHARLATMAAAHAAMNDLLRRIGMPDVPVEKEWRRAFGSDEQGFYLCADVPIADAPVS